MSKIEIGRYSSLLRRTLGMKGTTEVAGEPSPEISPTIQLEHPLNPEWDFLKHVRNVSVSERIANNVAGGGQMLLSNPADSGVIAVVDQLLMSSPSGSADFTARLLTAPAELLNFALTVATDTRWQTTALFTQAAIRATFVNNLNIGAGAGTILRHITLVNEILDHNPRVVLTPGFGLAFGSQTFNFTVFLTALWHERQLPAMEL